MKRLILLACTMALTPLAALADAAPAVPGPSCSKPELGGTQMTRSTGVHDPAKEGQAYLDCLKAYAEQEKAQAAAHGEAASKAISDYNSFVQEFNDYQNRPR